MNFADVKEWRIPVNGTMTEVTKVTDSQNRVIWQKQTGPDYTEPFYVENISNVNETLNIKKGSNDATQSPTLTIEYSTDKNAWNTLGTTSWENEITKTLVPGEKVYLRCNTSSWGGGNSIWGGNIIRGVSKTGGNIMSLLYGNNFTGNETNFPSGSTLNFNRLFYYNTTLVNVNYLLLPATRLTTGCYASMFEGCSGITQAPVLPAVSLTRECYYTMFKNCTSLTQAPALHAITLTRECYYSMFSGCTSLNKVTCYATSGINTNGSTSYWLSGVSSTGTFTKAAGATWPSGVNGIPSGWTVVNV